MNDMLLPLDKSDINVLNSAFMRLERDLNEAIEIIGENEYIRYEKYSGIIDELVYEIDRLREELYEKSLWGGNE